MLVRRPERSKDKETNAGKDRDKYATEGSECTKGVLTARPRGRGYEGVWAKRYLKAKGLRLSHARKKKKASKQSMTRITPLAGSGKQEA